ncbi:MAG: LytR C-terminal domain-containing protein [Actinomycetota bacterium]|nr:LytR C-terminal domain-containing protein [Actinomycetota bacterium]
MSLKTPLTLAVLVAVLVGGSVIGWGLATQEVPSLRDSTASDGPTCDEQTFDSGSTLESAAVTVNVINDGTVSGLAGETLRALQDKGFIAGSATDGDVRMPNENALVVALEPRSAPVRLVKRQLRGRVAVRRAEDPDIGTDVDVYVGNRFQGVARNARTALKVRGQTTVCVPVEESVR